MQIQVTSKNYIVSTILNLAIFKHFEADFNCMLNYLSSSESSSNTTISWKSLSVRGLAMGLCRISFILFDLQQNLQLSPSTFQNE